MKKISILTLAVLMPVCGAIAGGNKSMNNKNVIHQGAPVYWSVAEVINMPDNTPVVMLGRITKNMGEEMFVFEDSSGTIMMQIEEEDWNGRTVTADEVVTVYGHVDKNGNVTEIEVDSIMK